MKAQKRKIQISRVAYIFWLKILYQVWKSIQ
jgi:hypothetical protein